MHCWEFQVNLHHQSLEQYKVHGSGKTICSLFVINFLIFVVAIKV